MRLVITNLLMIILIMSSYDSHAGPVHCEGWGSGQYAGKQPSYVARYSKQKIDEIQKDNIGKASSEQSSTSPSASDRSEIRESHIDSAGISTQCYEGFPSYATRTRIVRKNTDPFNTIYQTSIEFCPLWADNCSLAALLSLTFFGALIAYLYTDVSIWFDQSDANFITGFNSGDTFSMAYAHNSEIHRVQPADPIPGTSDLINSERITKICAIYRRSGLANIVFMFFHEGLIGCVDEPLKSSPGVYDITYASSILPYVNATISKEDLIQAGSTFDQPLAFVQYDKQKLYLRYRFPGDNRMLKNLPNWNAQQCGSFPDLPKTKYCVDYNKDFPDKVCVCRSDKCPDHDYVQCVPRPTPADSNIVIVGEYTTALDPQGETTPAIRVVFAALDDKTGKPIMIDADGDIVVQHSDDNLYHKTFTPYALAKDPVQFKKINQDNNIEDLILQDYLLYRQSTSKGDNLVVKIQSHEAYGLSFHAIIPKMDATNNPLYYKLQPPMNVPAKPDPTAAKSSDPTAAKSSDPTAEDSMIYLAPQGCALKINDNYFTKCADYPKPAGRRDRSHCEKFCYTDCIKDMGAITKDVEAENAYCPGMYLGQALDDDSNLVGGPDNICVMLGTSWKEAMPKPYCVEMPIPCQAVTAPASGSGYAVWEEAEKGQTQEGTCNPEYGFEYLRDIVITKDDNIANTSEAARAKALQLYLTATSELQKLQQQNNDVHLNLNIQLSQFSMSVGKNVNADTESISEGGVTITSIPKKPTRQCLTNFTVRNIKNPCAKINSCSAIKEPFAVHGNIVLPDATSEYMNTASQRAIYGSAQSILSPIQGLQTIQGQCIAPFKYTNNNKEEVSTSNIPYRDCVTEYYTKNNKPYITRQYWGDLKQGVCIDPSNVQ